MNTCQKKILLVVKNSVFREALIKLINNEKNFTVCCVTENCNEALTTLSKISADLVIIDMSIGKKTCTELIKKIRKGFSVIPMLGLSMFEEPYYARILHLAGANGYLAKQDAPEYLIKATYHLLNGKDYFNSGLYNLD